MKRAIAVIAALAAAACGGSSQTITEQEARAAMPSADQARIGTPGSGGSAQVSGATSSSALVAPRSSALVVDTADLADATLALATGVNTSVVWVLGTVRLAVDLRPTGCSGDTCTWGPYSGALDLNEFRLTVTKVGDGQYRWAVSARPRRLGQDGAFVEFVTGDAFPSGVRFVGHGDFTIDLDAAAEGLDHRVGEVVPVGKIAVTNYDNRDGAKVSVEFRGIADGNNPGQTFNAAYQFEAGSTGGDLQIATRTIVGAAPWSLTLHSRWTGTGAGRGDAEIGLGTTPAFTQSQCWASAAESLALVYQASVPTQPTDTGVESSCAFSPAVPPTITAPE